MLQSPLQILKTHASRQEIIQIYSLKCSAFSALMLIQHSGLLVMKMELWHFICVSHLGSSEWVWGADCLIAPPSHFSGSLCCHGNSAAPEEGAHSTRPWMLY